MRIVDKDEIVVLLTDNGRLVGRKVRLVNVSFQETEGQIGYSLSAEMVFEGLDQSLGNLLEGVVPGLAVADAVENALVVYHLHCEGKIPVLRQISLSDERAVLFDRIAQAEVTVSSADGRHYCVNATVSQDGRDVITISGRYSLVHDSRPLLRTRR